MNKRKFGTAEHIIEFIEKKYDAECLNYTKKVGLETYAPGHYVFYSEKKKQIISCVYIRRPEAKDDSLHVFIMDETGADKKTFRDDQND